MVSLELLCFLSTNFLSLKYFQNPFTGLFVIPNLFATFLTTGSSTASAFRDLRFRGLLRVISLDSTSVIKSLTLLPFHLRVTDPLEANAYYLVIVYSLAEATLASIRRMNSIKKVALRYLLPTSTLIFQCPQRTLITLTALASKSFH